MKLPKLLTPVLNVISIVLLSSMINVLHGQSFLSHLQQTLKKDPPYGLLHYKFMGDTLGDFHYPLSFGRTRHHYMLHKKQVVIQLDGTGKLLQIDSVGQLSRMDSSQYEGYNFGAFNFVYKDTIFSLGGYGFWQFNGQLRYFNEKTNSWSVCKSNTTVPIRQWFNAQVYYDVKEGKIYAVYANAQPEWILESEKHDENLYVQCLDLQTKLWWDKPKIADRQVFKGSGWAGMAMFNAPEGMIAFIFKEVKIFDFKNNRLGSIRIAKAREVSEMWYQSEHLMMYSGKDSLYAINPTHKTINKMSFGKADIEWSAKALYTETESNLPIQSSVVLLVGLLAAVIGIFFWRRGGISKPQEKSTIAATINPNESIQEALEKQIPETPQLTAGRSVQFSDTLTSVEKGLLELILKNSAAGKMTSVLQVNEVLGIARKDVKSQNNIRASTLQMINHKFTAYSGLQDELIMKQRTAFDKRFFEYFIHAKYIHKVK
jgi:hypothetical protein